MNPSSPKKFLSDHSEKELTITLPYYVIHNIMVALNDRILDPNTSSEIREDLCYYQFMLVGQLRESFPECLWIYLKEERDVEIRYDKN
jgi:hypothetical protein